MFKKILLASSILVVSTTVVFAAPAPYIGAGLGVITNTANNKNSGSYRGMPINLFVGYGGFLNQQFYLAGEITGTLTTAKISDSGNGLHTSYGYGVSVLPGVALSDQTMAFARAGLVRTHFSHASTHTGAELGVGLQTSLTQNIDLRGEYDFVAYKTINKVSFKGTPRSDQFNVSLVYKL